MDEQKVHKKGCRVSGRVVFPNGHTVMMSGEFVTEVDGEVYFEAPIGPVVCDASTAVFDEED